MKEIEKKVVIHDSFISKVDVAIRCDLVSNQRFETFIMLLNDEIDRKMKANFDSFYT